MYPRCVRSNCKQFSILRKYTTTLPRQTLHAGEIECIGRQGCTRVSFSADREIWKSYFHRVTVHKFLQKGTVVCERLQFFVRPLYEAAAAAFVRGMRATRVPRHAVRIYSHRPTHATRLYEPIHTYERSLSGLTAL